MTKDEAQVCKKAFGGINNIIFVKLTHRKTLLKKVAADSISRKSAKGFFRAQYEEYPAKYMAETTMGTVRVLFSIGGEVPLACWTVNDGVIIAIPNAHLKALIADYAENLNTIGVNVNAEVFDDPRHDRVFRMYGSFYQINAGEIEMYTAAIREIWNETATKLSGTTAYKTLAKFLPMDKLVKGA